MLTEMGKILRQLRWNNDEIINDMAKKLEISPSTLSSMEMGKIEMSDEILKKIIDLYISQKDYTTSDNPNVCENCINKPINGEGGEING